MRQLRFRLDQQPPRFNERLDGPLRGLANALGPLLPPGRRLC
jgi:hypothetical protein